MSTFENYQLSTEDTAVYEDSIWKALGTRTQTQMADYLMLDYAITGLASEVGELAGHLKKTMRDDFGTITIDRRHKMLDELGDVLWYVARVAHELGLSLNQIANQNLVKLADRKERDKLHGSGDDR